MYLCLVRAISKYLLFQLLGWGTWALFNIYVAYIERELDARILTINLLLFALGLVLSHLYRKYFLGRWLLLRSERVIRNVLIATAILSIIYNLIYYGILLVASPDVFNYFNWESYLGTFISVYVLFSLWNVIYFAWIYIEKNKRIQIETLKMESALKDLEIKTIRSNLQPHFIFNSLNSIRALIDEDPELARNAITRISNILRNTITQQDATDTLENELALVEDYLALEKIRFEERLHFTKNVQPETLSLQVPAMMMQTLIENAIKHGISNLERGGSIALNTHIDDSQQLHIEIVNDIPENEVTPHIHSLGFGISSSRQRLQLLYANKAKFQFSTGQKKAVVHIIIPIDQPLKLLP